MNTCDFLLENARDDRIALVEASGSRTYGELKAASMRLAGALLACGATSGDRIGIIGQNSLFWVAAYLAIMKLGMTAVPLSVLFTSEEMDRSASWVGCAAVFIDRRQQKKFGGSFASGIPQLADDLIGKDAPRAWPPCTDGGEALADAALMFTSGTTAHPKAVRITHANIQANTTSIIEYLGLRNSDRMLVVLPFFYCFGTSLLHTHLRVGGSLVICNSFTFPETALDIMEREECTGFAGVPSSFQLLLRISTFKDRELPCLARIQQAGGKLHEILVDELVRSKPAARIFIMYGQTEATARLSYLPPEMLKEKRGSIGRGIPGTVLTVVSEKGEPVKPGEIGEIVARGKNISPGYYNDAEATARKFRDGALYTGDLATVDADGYIYIVDRKEDFIKSWGYRVSSLEVEECILELPEIVSAAVVGVPDIEAGEGIWAFVTVRPGAGLVQQDILDHCRSRLAKHMVPKTVLIIPGMPLNSNGKIMKSELRRMVPDSSPS